jgi:hypothetical protein
VLGDFGGDDEDDEGDHDGGEEETDAEANEEADFATTGELDAAACAGGFGGGLFKVLLKVKRWIVCV